MSPRPSASSTPSPILSFILYPLAIIIFYLLTAPWVKLWLAMGQSRHFNTQPLSPYIEKPATLYITPLQKIIDHYPSTNQLLHKYYIFVGHLL